MSIISLLHYQTSHPATPSSQCLLQSCNEIVIIREVHTFNIDIKVVEYICSFVLSVIKKNHQLLPIADDLKRIYMSFNYALSFYTIV